MKVANFAVPIRFHPSNGLPKSCFRAGGEKSAFIGNVMWHRSPWPPCSKPTHESFGFAAADW